MFVNDGEMGDQFYDKQAYDGNSDLYRKLDIRGKPDM